MKTKKIILFVLLAQVLTLTAFADDPVEVNGIKYTLVPKGKIATVTQNSYEEWGMTYSNYSGDITIPNTITYGGTTYSVVGIDDNAFKDSHVTSVTIPNSVTSIGPGAFQYCGSLVSVDIPNSVTSIGNYAFQYCGSLTSVIIPNSVTSIGDGIFSCCSSLTSVTILGAITSIPGECFASCLNLPSISIPNSVTNIGWNAFCGCSSLTSIIIPNSVTRIGSSAFMDCSSLTSVTILGSITGIGGSTFSRCSNLTTINIPNSVSYIDDSAFRECSSLTSITIPESVTYIFDDAFYGCSSLTSIVLPKACRSIGGQAFYGCTQLRSVTMEFEGNGDAGIFDGGQIRSKAFANCSNLEEFNIHVYGRWSMTYPVWDETTQSERIITDYGDWAIANDVASDAFEGSFVEYAKLNVPNDAINLYKAHPVWGQFGTITSIGNASTYYKLIVDVNSKGTVVYGTGANAVTITGSQTFNVKEQDNVVLTLTPATGYTLGTVTVNGDDKTTDVVNDVLTIANVNSDQNVSVKFVLNANSVPVTIGALGAATFCCDEALDFSGTDDVKAYIVSAFRPSTRTASMLRITDVPAGTGIVLLGNAGTYNIPLGTGETYVMNMLVGITADKTLNKTEGANSNFILSDGENGVGFYAVSDGSTLAAGKAYLSLPTSALPSNAQAIGLRFGDGDATGITEISDDNNDNVVWHSLDGRMLDGRPTEKGLYIVNGKKVLVK